MVCDPNEKQTKHVTYIVCESNQVAHDYFTGIVCAILNITYGRENRVLVRGSSPHPPVEKVGQIMCEGPNIHVRWSDLY